MMKKLFLFLGLILAAASLQAATDRFGNQRLEVPRSTYTDSPINRVLIASTTQIDTLSISSKTMAVSGGIYLRRIIFSGVNAATATFYDDGIVSAVTSTRTKVAYVPSLGGGGVTGAGGIDFDMFFSSALLYDLQCTAPCPTTVLWDYSTIPRFGGVGK